MTTPTPPPYVLGVSEAEVRRIILQSDLYHDATEDALRRAGIGPGMDVLDVGTGAGGVALIASELVGPTGSVTAVDASPKMVAIACARAERHPISNITCVEADLASWQPDRRFDAVTGRLVVMHLHDPVDVLRRLARAVRPGGVVAFADFVMSAAMQQPAGPLFTQSLERVVAAFRGVGRPTDMGLQLGIAFRAAGLPSPRYVLGGVVGEGPATAVYALLSETVATLAPVMHELGITDEPAVEAPALERALLAEAAGLGAIALPPLLVTAWTRLPEDAA